MTKICEDRVVLVTGGGRGLGRSHALTFAFEGAKVVVNDTGVELDGSGGSKEPADSVVAEIQAMGGEAIASYEDAASWEGARSAVEAAVDGFGRLDVLVNNAGILRDRMLINMTEEDWDLIARTHLRGTFAPTRWAATYWREQSKAGVDTQARVINTSSPSGLYGNVGQTNYGAAKAGIAAFTIIAAEELARYGVTVNAIAPGARTRMTEHLTVLEGAEQDGGEDTMSPERISPLVVWLGSVASAGITGRVFNVWGDELSVAEGWLAGPRPERPGPYTPAEVGDLVPDLVARAQGPANTWGRVKEG
jgi:NAD(P)-dependent dehydrogenase (short-subunit alcohol dehydrogenase family)